MSSTMRALFGVVFCALAALGLPARAETITWTGAAGTTAWTAAGNWDLNRTPGVDDDVVIPASATLVELASAQSEVRSLDCRGTLRVNFGSGRLTVREATTVTGTLQLDNSAVIDGTGDITILGRFEWNGPIRGNGLLNIAPGGTCVSATFARLERSIVNRGTLQLRTNSLNVANADITNEAEGLLTITFGQGLRVAGGSPRLINLGTLECSATYSIDLAFESHGLIRVRDGGLTISAPFICDGQIDLMISTDLVFNVDGDLPPNCTVTGNGRLGFTRGIHHVECEVAPTVHLAIFGLGTTYFDRDYTCASFYMAGGTSGVAAGPGHITCQIFECEDGTLSVGGLTGWRLQFSSGDSCTLRTNVTITNSIESFFDNPPSLRMDGGSMTLTPTCRWTVTESPRFINQGGSNVFRNEGLITMNGYSMIVGVPFENTGTVRFSGQTALTLSGGGVNSGTIDIGSTGVLMYGATYDHSDAPPIGTGEIRFNAGEHVLPEGYPLGGIRRIESAAIVEVDRDWDISQPLYLAGTLRGGGNRTLRTGFQWGNGAQFIGPCTIEIPAGESVLSDGSGVGTLENVALANHGSLTAAGLVLRSASIVNEPGGTFLARNNATIANESGTNVLDNRGTLGNWGSTTGTATIAVPLANSGTITTLVGTLNITGPFSGFQDGVLSGNYRLERVLALGGRVVQIIAGNVELTGAGARLSDTPTGTNLGQLMQIAPGGILRLRSGGRLQRSNELALTNTGELDVGTGCTLAINGIISQSAGRMVANGTVTATSNYVNITNGEFSGAGTVQPSLRCAAVLSPGSPVGTLTVIGSAQLQPTASLQIEVGGTTPGVGYDRVVASGAFVANGNLTIQLMPGFEPQLGDVFEVVQGTISGRFTSVFSPSLGPGRCWAVDYLPTAIRLRVADIRGDLDGDGETGLQDLAALLQNFGRVGDAGRPDGDLDEDRDVDLPDLVLLLSAFGEVCH